MLDDLYDQVLALHTPYTNYEVSIRNLALYESMLYETTNHWAFGNEIPSIYGDWQITHQDSTAHFDCDEDISQWGDWEYEAVDLDGNPFIQTSVDLFKVNVSDDIDAANLNGYDSGLFTSDILENEFTVEISTDLPVFDDSHAFFANYSFSDFVTIEQRYNRESHTTMGGASSSYTILGGYQFNTSIDDHDEFSYDHALRAVQFFYITKTFRCDFLNI